MLDWFLGRPKQLDTLVKVHIIEDSSTPSFQEGLVLQQLQRNADKLDEANDAMDAKAMGLLQASSLVTGLLALLDYSIAKGSWLSGLAVIVALVCLFCMVLALLEAFRPRAYDTAGVADWDDIYKLHLSVSPEACFLQIVSNLINSIKSVEKINQEKREMLYWAVVLFAVQVFCLFAVAFGNLVA